jgi:hypothetical protein
MNPFVTFSDYVAIPEANKYRVKFHHMRHMSLQKGKRLENCNIGLYM